MSGFYYDSFSLHSAHLIRSLWYDTDAEWSKYHMTNNNTRSKNKKNYVCLARSLAELLLVVPAYSQHFTHKTGKIHTGRYLNYTAKENTVRNTNQFYNIHCQFAFLSSTNQLQLCSYSYSVINEREGHAIIAMVVCQWFYIMHNATEGSTAFKTQNDRLQRTSAVRALLGRVETQWRKLHLQREKLS